MAPKIEHTAAADLVALLYRDTVEEWTDEALDALNRFVSDELSARKRKQRRYVDGGVSCHHCTHTRDDHGPTGRVCSRWVPGGNDEQMCACSGFEPQPDEKVRP